MGSSLPPRFSLFPLFLKTITFSLRHHWEYRGYFWPRKKDLEETKREVFFLGLMVQENGNFFTPPEENSPVYFPRKISSLLSFLWGKHSNHDFWWGKKVSLDSSHYQPKGGQSHHSPSSCCSSSNFTHLENSWGKRKKSISPFSSVARGKESREVPNFPSLHVTTGSEVPFPRLGNFLNLLFFTLSISEKDSSPFFLSLATP